MTKYRTKLPQLAGDVFLTDSGLETTLVFLKGYELPFFAAFDLLKTPAGRQTLTEYFDGHSAIAKDHSCGFIFESVTWRASRDWGERLGYTPETLARANRDSIAMLTGLRRDFEQSGKPGVISGCIGPRGDGYDPRGLMTPAEAESYHMFQAGIFAETEADLITAITMTNAEEAIGITRAAAANAMPVVISFTVETDGRLPTGQPLNEAIEAVDAATEDGPAYYMINCAHPTHFDAVLRPGRPWTRFKGLRANASRCSHAELDEADELDDGDPWELGTQYADIFAACPQITILGGCCGTDHRHIEEIASACLKRRTA